MSLWIAERREKVTSRLVKLLLLRLCIGMRGASQEDGLEYLPSQWAWAFASATTCIYSSSKISVT